MRKPEYQNKSDFNSKLGNIVMVVILTILWHIFLYAIFVEDDEYELCPGCRSMEYRRPGIEDANHRQYPRKNRGTYILA